MYVDVQSWKFRRKLIKEEFVKTDGQKIACYFKPFVRGKKSFLLVFSRKIINHCLNALKNSKELFSAVVLYITASISKS